MTLRNVPKSYTLEEQRQEINLMAVDLDRAVDGVQSFTGVKTFDDFVTFSTDVTFEANSYWGDGDQAFFGADNDMILYHTGADGLLENSTGDLYITSGAGTRINIDPDVYVSGDLNIGDQNNTTSQLKIFSGGTDVSPEYFKIFAGGSVAVIQLNDHPTLGEMQIKARQGIALYGNTSHISVWAKPDGSGSLLYQTLEKLVTTNTGITITGNIDDVTDISCNSIINNASGGATFSIFNTGNAEFDGTVTASNFSGPVTGNADTATSLQTARNIAGNLFDGTADITIAATDLSDTDQALATTSDVTFNTITKSGGLSTEFLKADGSVDSTTYLSSYTETDPVVGAITGIVKADGAGNIGAAVAGTDYATAAQGALADTALQAETITLTTLKAEVAAATDFADFQSRIAAL